MTHQIVLSAEQLTAGYGKKAVAEDITIRVEKGEILCLIGPNGAGKSTILKTMLRQLEPLAGTVLLENVPLSSLKEKDLARKSAAVLTGRIAPEYMTCEEIVGMGRYPYTGTLGILSEADRKAVDEAVQTAGIGEIRKAEFSRVSDGQRQRVMLARALCQEPDVLVMDEPTSFLDIRNKLEFMAILRRLVRTKRIAAVMSLHELELAQKFTDRVVCVSGGRIVSSGTPEEIFTGGTIQNLYDVQHGSYDCLSGTVEGEKTGGAPSVFVIGGGGSGIPVYRRLQREGIPFAAGVLPENDIDYPVAKALAAVVISERAHEPVSDSKVAEALKVLETCDTVLCPGRDFGSVNAKNGILLDYAQKNGILEI